MTEQRGDAAAEAIAHDANAPSAVDEATRPPSGEHGPDDDAAHHSVAVDDHDDHAHMGEALGPVDLLAWSAGVLGVVLGLVVAICFALASAGFA